MPERGCGSSRTRGGIYLCVGLSKYGSPVEHFIVDQPFKIDTEQMGISPIGMHLIGGHLFDWVGASHYPTPADFVEEVKRHGLSRKISGNFNFKELTQDTMHYLIHPKAFVDNWDQFPERRCACPKEMPEHPIEGAKECCAGLWWQMAKASEDGAVAEIEVPLPDGSSYLAFTADPNLPMRVSPAIFMRFKLSHIEVVGHDDDAVTEAAVEAASKSGLEVMVTDE